MNDGYVGKLVFVRVYAGSLAKGSALYNPAQVRPSVFPVFSL